MLPNQAKHTYPQHSISSNLMGELVNQYNLQLLCQVFSHFCDLKNNLGIDSVAHPKHFQH